MIPRREIAWGRRWRSYGRPEGDLLEFMKSHGGPLERLDGLRCLALLGEPGVGKTSEIEHALTRLGDSQHHVRIDLREFASEEMFVSEWKEAVTSALRDQPGLVTVWVDAFDEGLLNVKKLAALLPAQLRKLNRDEFSRLSIRLACRTGAWPKGLEDSLAKAFYHPNEGAPPWVQELQELDDEDLATFCGATAIRAGFEEAIGRAGVGMFASRPVTLWLLADIYQDNGRLPGSRWELFEQALGHLILDANKARVEDGTLQLPPVEDALDLCGIAAAAMLFSGRTSLDFGLGPPPAGVVRVDEVVADPARREQLATLVRHTAIFKRAGPDSFDFAHRTYAEFLVARVMERRGVSDADLQAIISGPEGFVVPHLREFAGWAAARRPALQAGFVEREPDLVLEGDPGQLPTPLQLRTVRRLFERIGARELRVAGGETVHLLHRLPRAVLVEAFRELFASPPASDGRLLYDALWVIRDARLSELSDVVATFVADERGNVGDRRSACAVLVSLNEERARQVLRPYLALNGDGSRHSLFARALGTIGKYDLSPDVFFSGISDIPDDQVIGGEAWGFVANDLPEVVRVRGWQSEALTWAAGVLGVGPHDHRWEMPLRRLVWRWAARGGEDQRVRVATVKLLSAVGRHHASLQPDAEDTVSRELKVLLLKDVLGLDEDSDGAMHASRWMLHRDDLTWLLELHATTPRADVRQRIREAVGSIVDVGNPEQGEILHRYGDGDAELKSSLPWFFGPIPLDSTYAKQCRKQRHRELEHERKAAEVGDPRERVRDAVEKARVSPGAWWWLLRQLTLKPGMTRYGDWCATVDKLPGWESALPETREGIVAAAQAFIEHERPDVGDSWLHTNEVPTILLIGVVAAFSIAAVAPERLLILSIGTWKAWFPAILRLGGMVRDGTEPWEALVRSVPEGALEVVEHVAKPILTSGEDGIGAEIFLGRIRAHAPLQTSGLRDLLVEVVGLGALPQKVDSACIEALLQLDRDAGLGAAAGRLAAGSASEGTLRVALLAAEAPAWSAALDAIRGNQALGERALGALADRHAPWRVAGDPAVGWPDRLPSGQLGELYELMMAVWPPTPGEFPEGGHTIGTREQIAELRDRLPMMLAERGGSEECQELGRLHGILSPGGVDLRFALSVAKQNFRTRSWQALPIPEILALMGETPGSAAAIRQSRDELRALSPRAQASVLRAKSLHAFIAAQVLASCAQLLERASLLATSADEDKFSDLLLTDLVPRVQELGWTVDGQSRGGRSAAGTAGQAHGGVGERDLVLRHEGQAFALVEALVLDSVTTSLIVGHLDKLISKRRYNPTGIHDAVMILYVQASDFSGFWVRYLSAITSNVPSGLSATGTRAVETNSTTMTAIDVTYSDGTTVLHVALAIGIVNG